MSLPEMDVTLTVEDLNRLWRATIDEARMWREIAVTHPLRVQDPNTKRYDIMQDSYKLARRAHHFRDLAKQLERQYEQQLRTA